MPKYIVQSQYAPGSFGWAMDQLDGGNHMRRPHWPYIGESTPLFIWHDEGYGVLLGFSNSMIGNDSAQPIVGIGTPSMGYHPSDADLMAMDWRNADAFDWEERDAVPPWETLPSQEQIWQIEEANRRQERSANRKAIAVLVFMLGLALYVGAIVAGVVK